MPVEGAVFCWICWIPRFSPDSSWNLVILSFIQSNWSGARGVIWVSSLGSLSNSKRGHPSCSGHGLVNNQNLRLSQNTLPICCRE